MPEINEEKVLNAELAKESIEDVEGDTVQLFWVHPVYPQHGRLPEVYAQTILPLDTGHYVADVEKERALAEVTRTGERFLTEDEYQEFLQK